MAYNVFSRTNKVAPQTYDMGEERVRNIIVYGRKGAGKASVANAIFGDCKLFEIGDANTTFEDTDPVRQGVKKINGYNYRITLVDSVRGDGKGKAFAEQLDKMPKDSSECIFLIIFVCRLNESSTQENLAFEGAMKRISKIRGGADRTALVVTGCEFRNRLDTKTLIGNKKGKIVGFSKKGVFPVALLQLSNLPDMLEEKARVEIDKDKAELRTLLNSRSLFPPSSVDESFPKNQENQSRCERRFVLTGCCIVAVLCLGYLALKYIWDVNHSIYYRYYKVNKY